MLKKFYGLILCTILLLTLSKNSYSQFLINETFNTLTSGSKSPLSGWAYSRGDFPVIDETYSSSGWQADDFGNVVGGPNLTAARGNIYGNARNFWLITPAFDLNNTSIKTLSFDESLTSFGDTTQGSFDSNDDSLIVAYSLDGGTTWSYSQILKVYTDGDFVPAAGQNEIIDLSSIGTESNVSIGFYYVSRVSNSNDIEFFIDNLKVGALSSFDMEASSIISPLGIIYNSPSPVKAVFTNNGSNSLSGKYYAAISDINSSVIYSDSVSFTDAEPNEIDTIEFSPFNFSSNGNYSITFIAKANGDLNSSNDTLAANFYAQIQNNNLVVVYNNSNLNELENKYVVFAALNSLSIPFDSLDRDPGTPDLTPWSTVIWCEEEDIPSEERAAIISYLNSGTSDSQKQLLIAGDDIGFNHGRSSQPQFDSLFYWYYLHAKFFDDDGNGIIDNSGIIGDAVNNGLRDSLISFFPDGIGTNFGSVPAYRFGDLSSQSDTVAGVAFDGATYNVIYYGFEFREIATNLSPSSKQIISGSLDWFNNSGGETPVELTSFKADVTEGKIKLTWTTATEKNNNGFSIERKSKGESFKQIAFVKGKGSTTEKSYYLFEDEKPASGIYNYRLKQIDYDGSYNFSNEISVEISVPNKFSLEQNYPNPFNPTTKIKYSIPSNEKTNRASSVQLKVYDIIGNEVETLVNKEQAAGTYEVEFNSKGLSSGVYFYRLEASNPEATSKQAFISTRKMLIIK